MTENPYRELPSVERLLSDERVLSLTARHGHEAVLEMARALLDEYRARIADEGRPPEQEAVEALLARATRLAPTLRPVINATGVILHTNLGRAPLSDATLEAMAQIGRGYSTLEFDIEAGGRGSRFAHLQPLLRRVTGADDGLALNNNAGAVLLALAALAAGREVIISRGELIEIGGGFRIPDVLRQSGATLVEVGTTNRTYVRDYAEAVTERTAAILRVHTSNFRVIGFTEQPSLGALAELARDRGLLLLDDLGSGSLIETQRYGLPAEPTVQQSVAAGADVVLFSGDKLVGGPQAGIAVGRAEPIAALRRHPLARALRMDKASIAGLAATLEHYARGEAEIAVPAWRMLAEPAEEIGRRARRWALAAGRCATVVEGRSMIGGGSLPEESVPTVLCALDPPGGSDGGGADRLAHALRSSEPPVVARIEGGRVLLDPRTVDPADDRAVATIVGAACVRLLERELDAEERRAAATAAEAQSPPTSDAGGSVPQRSPEAAPPSRPPVPPAHSPPAAPPPFPASPPDRGGPFPGGSPPGR
jgi:L-seryl-tRNA(Ser) seleniumtransferase